MHSGMHELHSLEHTLAHTHIHTQGWRLGQQDATTMTLMLASACPHMDSLTLSRCQLSMAPLRAQISQLTAALLLISGVLVPWLMRGSFLVQRLLFHQILA